MLHPDVAYDIASGHGKARLAQAATPVAIDGDYVIAGVGVSLSTTQRT